MSAAVLAVFYISYGSFCFAEASGLKPFRKISQFAVHCITRRRQISFSELP